MTANKLVMKLREDEGHKVYRKALLPDFIGPESGNMSTQIIPYYSLLMIKKKLSFDVKRLKILEKYSYVFRGNVIHQNQKLKQGS